MEFWYRGNAARREMAEATFAEKISEVGGELIDRSLIDAIRYHAILAQVSPAVIQGLLDHPDVGIVAFDDVMMLRPQSMVSGPVEGDLQDAAETDAGAGGAELDTPIAALLDGMPMTQHDCD